MFLMNRTWPGTSTNASSRPDGSVVQAKPRSMVRPRVFSSAKRSGSMPVRASTSVDLPWSTWPAVATTCIRACRGPWPPRRRRRVDRPQVEMVRSVVHPGDDRRVAGCRRAAVWSPARRTPADGIDRPGSDPPPGDARAVHRRARRRVASARCQQALDGGGRHGPERDGVALPAQVGEGGGLEGGEHQAAGPQGPGQRVAGAAVDQVAAAGDDAGLRAAEQLVAGEGDQGGAGGERLAGRRLARPARRAGRRSATGVAASSRPEPRSATTGGPRPASASTATVSVKPTMR